MTTLSGPAEGGAGDGKQRCDWGAWDDPLYVAYHDDEWGVPSHHERHLFELLILEGAQAGLSWSTILRKRRGFRAAFRNFDPAAVAAFGEADVVRLLADPGIVRNRAKIEAAIGNAQATVALPPEVGGLNGLVWASVGGKPIQNCWTSVRGTPAQTAESVELSRALKARGFRFVGPTICYAFMQAVGLVNDHTVSCFRHAEVAALA
jgi:DNA-3-methyladenine glycosylase I